MYEPILDQTDECQIALKTTAINSQNHSIKPTVDTSGRQLVLKPQTCQKCGPSITLKNEIYQPKKASAF